MDDYHLHPSTFSPFYWPNDWKSYKLFYCNERQSHYIPYIHIQWFLHHNTRLPRHHLFDKPLIFLKQFLFTNWYWIKFRPETDTPHYLEFQFLSRSTFHYPSLLLYLWENEPCSIDRATTATSPLLVSLRYEISDDCIQKHLSLCLCLLTETEKTPTWNSTNKSSHCCSFECFNCYHNLSKQIPTLARLILSN